MKILVNQSLCGEKGGAWDLLKTTLKDTKTAQAIAFKTDLHDTASGKSWGPAIRGFCYDEYFLLIKSFVDPSTTVRPGRAFSHVLIIEKKDLTLIENLRPLIDILPTEVDKNAAIEPIAVEQTRLKKKESTAIIQEPFLSRFKKVISGYVNYQECSNTIVWVGDVDYDLAVVELWERLTGEEKEQFNFDIYFNANAVPKGSLNLITISERHLSKFQNAGYLIVGPNDTANLSTLSEQILVGHIESYNRITDFANAIGAEPFPRSELDTISIAITTFEGYKDEKDFKRLNTLSHIVATYSPSAKKGASFKQQLVKHIAELIEVSPYQEFSILKSFKVESFSKSDVILTESVTKWLGSRLLDETSPSSKDIGILDLLKKPIAKDWLTKAIHNVLKAFFNTITSQQLSLVFGWLSIHPAYFAILREFLDSTKENCFIEALPTQLPTNLTELFLSFAMEKKMLLFHAHLLLMEMQASEALEAQIKVDLDQNSRKGVDHILSKLNEKTIMACAILLKDQRIMTKAASLCKATPTLLNGIDLKDATWQNIWLESVKSGNRIDKGFKNFNSILAQVFDLIISGTGFNSDLLTMIANSKYANLLQYSRRSELWPKLNNKDRALFLKETSAQMLSDLSNGKNVNVPNDATLSKYIFDHAINDFLYYNRSKIRPVIPIFKRFSNIPNYFFEDYLRQFHGALDGSDAKHLGKMIVQRGSTNAAHLVYQRSAKNNSWSIALKECYQLLPLVDKGKIFLSGLVPKVKIGKEQWWSNVEQILCNYYPNPVSLTRVWVRAGGHESDLLLNVTARETWAKAVKKLRNNEIKKFSMNALLKEVDKEFGHVEDFKFLFKIRKSYI